MSNEQSNEPNKPSPPTVPPDNSPQTGTGSTAQQQPNPLPLQPVDPFTLDQRLISEIQKGGNAPERTAIQQPEIVRNEPTEKK